MFNGMTTQFKIIIGVAVLVLAGSIYLMRAQPSSSVSNVPPTSNLERNTALPLPSQAATEKTYSTQTSATLRYPADWNYRENETRTEIEFFPLSIPADEIETAPKITLKITPLDELIAGYTTPLDWYETEVQNGFGRMDAAQEMFGSNQMFTFTEGLGEYPHYQSIIIHNQTAYWFSIDASSKILVDQFPLIVRTLEFN